MKPLYDLGYKVLNHVYLKAYQNKKVITCQADEISRVIENNGDVRVCELTQVIGNIKDHDYHLREIPVSTQFKKYIKQCSCVHPCYVPTNLKTPLNATLGLISLVKEKIK